MQSWTPWLAVTGAALVLAYIAVFAVRLGVDFEPCVQGTDHRFDQFDHYDDAQTLVGLQRRDVHGRYGEPTTVKFKPEWQVGYWMRPQGFCIDGWYLVLNYGEGDEVVAAGVVAD